MKMNKVDSYSTYYFDDWHATFTIKLGQEIEEGLINFSDSSWDFDSFDEEQRNRFWEKFKNRFYWRERGIRNFKHWKWEVLRKLNEVMPKYKLLYQAIADGNDRIMAVYNEYGKSRNIYSEFPQTLLSNNQDYASSGVDREHENIYDGDYLERVEKFKTYDDVDVMLLNEFNTFFSSMESMSINGY